MLKYPGSQGNLRLMWSVQKSFSSYSVSLIHLSICETYVGTYGAYLHNIIVFWGIFNPIVIRASLGVFPTNILLGELFSSVSQSHMMPIFVVIQLSSFVSDTPFVLGY